MHITTLYEQKGKEEERTLPSELVELYDGDLSFPEVDRPYVIGNFVQTIDGVVSFKIPGRSGGGEISGNSAEDRFVMGLLRSAADAVLVGSGTLHGDPGHVRIPEFIYPEAKHLYASFRKMTGKPLLPLNIILTASGRIDLKEPTFHTDGLKAVIITTDEGAARLAQDHGRALSTVIVRSTGEKGATSPRAVLKILAGEFGVRLLLHEGGPTIFGEFLSAGMIDELFLTCAPQIAGRQKNASRPSLAGEGLFLPETAPWFSLQSIKKSSNHLLLRYIATKKVSTVLSTAFA
jgi:riboflavin biosynthesis pyrimidine reductase